MISYDEEGEEVDEGDGDDVFDKLFCSFFDLNKFNKLIVASSTGVLLDSKLAKVPSLIKFSI